MLIMLSAYIRLTRLNRPIGIFLVLWPALWSLWLAAEGLPDPKLLLIFTLGAVLMRSAGCVINDFADRNLDGQVERTRDRPLVKQEVSLLEAWSLCLLLCFLAFILVLFTNALTIQLSLGALALAASYPFMKRYTHLPQVFLGAAFAWSVPMAFAAQAGSVPAVVWLIFVVVVVWTVTYDTFYAMVDREDDLRAGIKSTAVLFGDLDRVMTACLQVLVLLGLMLIGRRMELGWPYDVALLLVGFLFAYQQHLIRNREPKRCFKAFTNNNWVGLIILLGVAGHYALIHSLS